MKKSIGSRFNMRSSKVLSFITVIFVSLLFFALNLQGSASRVKEQSNENNKDKAKQVEKSSEKSDKLESDDTTDSETQKTRIYAPRYRTLNPLMEMRLMQERIDRFFNSTINHFHNRPGIVLSDERAFIYSPKMDISENDNQYIVRMDLPGMKKTDIKITFRGRRLVITGNREQKIENSEDDKAISYERSYGEFTRIFSLPGPFDKEKTKAKYKAGVLTITIEKIPEEKEKEITIEVEEESN